jgi:hypothetical protein
MKYLIYFFGTFFCTSCTHNSNPKIFKTLNKTGPIINISNYNDTLILGDTIGLQYNVTNKIITDSGEIVNIKNIINTGIGYIFKRRYGPINQDSDFNFSPLVVEQNKSYLQFDGRFLFKPLLMPFIGATIHYVPQDTGLYVLSTDRNQYLVCDVEGSTDQVQINFFPDFNAQSKHEYLLDSYPIAKLAYESGKLNDASPYYCFYVKPK